jgi:Putative quorum-sensing-regulated virulence factor
MEATMAEPVMTFGKHKGWALGQLPDDYLAWLVSGKCDFLEPGGWAYAAGLRAEIDKEVERRNAAADENCDDEETVDDTNWPPGMRNLWETMKQSTPHASSGRGKADSTRQAYEEAERKRKETVYANRPTETCTRCHDTGYVSAFGMKVNCNCERGLLHKIRDLELNMNAERTKREVAERELMHERQRANTAERNARRPEQTSTEYGGRSREDGPSVPQIRSSVTHSSCMEILTSARRGYAKSLHPDVAKGDETKKKHNEDRLKVINASLDFLEKCANTLRNA